MTETDTIPGEQMESYRDKESPDKLVSSKAFTTSEKFIPITDFETQPETLQTLPSPSGQAI